MVKLGFLLQRMQVLNDDTSGVDLLTSQGVRLLLLNQVITLTTIIEPQLIIILFAAKP